MDSFQLLASPWWVNLLAALPFIAYFSFRKQGLSISAGILIAVAVFGIAFGYDEAVVVVYLRAVLGISTNSFSSLPSMYASIETFREAATMVMPLAVACLSSRALRERVAIFLWAFAFWDLS